VGANRSKQIAWITTLLIALFGLMGSGPKTYRMAIVFLGPFLWGIYFSRERLHIRPWQFAIFAAALLLHDLGSFGTYGHFYYGLEFDTYVHFCFGVAGGFILAPALRFNFGLNGWKLWVGTILVIMGIGALHELLEFLSTLLLGDKGMLKLNDPDRFDTQKDLGNNLLGCLSALTLLALRRVLWRRTSISQTDSRLDISSRETERG
jgi:uncharacterized membrane protein YjdF